jgi:hypothetical protein
MQNGECMPPLACMRTLVRVGATDWAIGTFMVDGSYLLRGRVVFETLASLT